MFIRILIFIVLFLLSFFTHASTPGTVEYFIHNDTNGRPYAVGRVANHPWPTTTSSQPFTLGTGTKAAGSNLIRYAPQRITAASFARGMFNAIANGHPLAKAAVVGWAVYECATAESGLCSEGQTFPPECPDGGELNEYFGQQICQMPAPSGSLFRFDYGAKQTSHSAACDSAAAGHANSYTSSATVNYSNGGGALIYGSDPTKPACKMTLNISVLLNNGTGTWNTTTSNYTDNTIEEHPNQYYCPPESDPSFTMMGGAGTATICYKPAVTPDPIPPKDITLDDLKDWIAERPDVFNDLSDDVLKDPTTGKPNDTFFDNPKSTPISPALSDAFESIATGKAQDTNPSAPHYISPDIKDQIEDALGKFHNDEPFVDPYTDTTVTPETSPSENPAPYTPPSDITVTVEQSWEGFPGITQAQYEESNNGWASDLASRLPNDETDWGTFDDEFKDGISDNPDLPFEPFDFGVLWPISGGQCVGYSAVVSVGTIEQSILFDRHCPPYNEWAHPFLSWFLQILAALQILTIFNKTMLSGS